METGCDIYDNLPKFDTYEEIEKLRIENDQLKDLIQSLESDIEKLCSKITEMKKSQDVLSRNISELYKTAKNEIDRKDRTIADLRAQLEKFTFQMRNNCAVKRERSPSMNADLVYKRFKKEHDDKRGYSRSKSISRRSRSRSRERYKHRTNRDRDRKKDDEKKANKPDGIVKKDKTENVIINKKEVRVTEKGEHKSKKNKITEIDDEIKKGEVIESEKRTSEKQQNEKIESKKDEGRIHLDIRKTETNEILEILEFEITEKKDIKTESKKAGPSASGKTNGSGKTIETGTVSDKAKKEEMPQFTRKEKQENLKNIESTKSETSDDSKKEEVLENPEKRNKETEENKSQTKQNEFTTKKWNDDKKKKMEESGTVNNLDKQNDNKKIKNEKGNMKKSESKKSEINGNILNRKGMLKSEKTEAPKKESHKEIETKNAEGNRDKRRKEKNLESAKTTRSEKQEHKKNKTEESRTNLGTENISHKTEKEEMPKSGKIEKQGNGKKLESKETDIKKELPLKSKEEKKEKTSEESEKQEKRAENVIDETKKEEVKESGRVLRSTIRKNSHRETTPSLMDSLDYTNKVTLSDDGEIPVLHIPDDTSPKANNKSIFDPKLCASTPIQTDDLELLKQDLHLSFEQNSNENAVSTSASFNNTGVTPRKRRKRYLVQLID